MTERSEGILGAVTERSGIVDDAGETPEERRALFHVVRGEPTDQELAALSVVLAAAASVGAPAETGPRSAWNDRVARLRTGPHPGPGAWRTSTWPR